MAPDFQIPMDDVPSGWSPLDDSLRYNVRISDVALEHAGPNAKMPGAPMLNVTLDVRSPAEWEGKTLFYRMNLPVAVKPTDTVAERRKKLERGNSIKPFMDAFQLTWSPTGFRTEDWIGAEAACDVENEEYEGQVRSRPKKFYKTAA